MSNALTTAQAIGQFRRELIAEGITGIDELASLVANAARELLAEGLLVGDPFACRECGKRTLHHHHQTPRVGPLPSD